MVDTRKRGHVRWLFGVCSFAVLIAGWPPAASLGWQREFDGTARGHNDKVLALAVDSAGGVIAAGHLWNAGSRHDFVVVKLAGATGAELWRREIDGTGHSIEDEDVATAVAVDSAGDVIAAGRLRNSHSRYDSVVVKLAGGTGKELWRREIDGTYHGDDYVADVGVDEAGDVIAVGSLENVGSTYDFVVMKLAGATGAELWRREITGSGEDGALTLAVDAIGDLVAGGFLGWDFAVVKLAGTTGAELWRQRIHGTDPISEDRAETVAVNGSGDAIAAGWLGGTVVMKLAGATGTELWRREYVGTSVAIDDAGNVILGGELVLKLAGATGAELWQQEINGPALSWGARAVAVDSAGDVIAAGSFRDVESGKTIEDFRVVKLAGATGAELWRQDIDGIAPLEEFGGPRRVALDGADDVVAAGTLRNVRSRGDFAVVKLNGTDGTQSLSATVPCPASPDRECDTGFEKGRLVVNERRSDEERLKIKWMKGPPLAGSDFGNPLFIGGAAYTVCIYDDTDTLVSDYIVDRAAETCGKRGCWTHLGKPPPNRKHKGFRYTDKATTADGIRRLELLVGRTGKAMVQVNGKNNRANGRIALPTGVAAALQRSTGGVTAQLFSNHIPRKCFSQTLPTVRKADRAVYKATMP